jgi:predicted MFS family arabinose efflux permease
MLNVLVTKMVADLFDGKERLLAMSILINSWPIGIGVALLVVGQLGQHEGWQWGMFATAVFAVIGLLGVAAIYRAPDGAAPAATSGLGLETLTRSDWHRLLLGSLPWLLYNASFQIMMSFMPSFFVDNGLALTRATGLTAVSAVGFVLGVQAGGLLLKRSAHPDRICHAALAGLCLALLALSTGTAPLLWVVLGGLFGGLPAAALVSLPAEVLRAESRSAGMGIFFTVYYVGCAILPAIAGLLYDRAGGGAALWMAAGLAFACIPILNGFRRTAAPVPAGCFRP